MRIFLVGYMGSGKTTLGKQLARKLDLPFYDLDAEIELTKGQSVLEIFSKEGEAVFRGLERQQLKKLIEANPNLLLSCGGGTPCFYDNMQVMNANGITIYLKMDAASLAYRLVNAKITRPILQGKSESELEEYIRQHLREREDMYNEAQIIINALGFSTARIDELAEKIRNHSK
jgi:shikimate kinase